MLCDDCVWMNWIWTNQVTRTAAIAPTTDGIARQQWQILARYTSTSVRVTGMAMIQMITYISTYNGTVKQQGRIN